jgi:FGFR1 oncogene partner
MRENPQSSLAAEIIQEFMEFYRLNYSLAVFAPETNLKGKTENRSALAAKAGIVGTADTPLLIQILEALANGGSKDKAPSPSKEPSFTKLEPLKPI